jgi:aconitate hydratase
MGVLPLQFSDGDSVESLGLTGEEAFEVSDLESGDAQTVTVSASRDGGDEVSFEARVRIDTPNEREYFRNGGILHRVLRDLKPRAS